MNQIPLFRPSHDQREEEAVATVLRSRWTGLGPRTEEFEQAFAKYLGVKYAVATSSCTAALQLAYMLYDIGPGHEVILPTITFCSTAHAVCHLGGKPVFADVRPDTLLLHQKDINSSITFNTRLVVPVLYAGQLLGCTFSLPTVYDCAHACGSEFNASGKTCCWSFHSVKNLSCGDGGMLTTDDPDFASRARRLRWLGIDKTTWDRSSGKGYAWEYRVDEIGFKSHMNDLTAAIGLVQLAKLPEMQARRNALVKQYREELKGHVGLLPDAPGSSHHLFVVGHPLRNELANHLKEQGITTGVHYRPIHLYSCYGEQPKLPVAEKVWQEILSLPLFPDLTSAEVSFICEQIRVFVKECIP